jgi:hypothetical protein
MTTRMASYPLRAALSVPAVITLLVQQAGRLWSPPALLWLLFFEVTFVAAAFFVARRSPGASWAWVPVMWVGVGLGALVDAWLLGGPKDGTLPLVGLAAPALAVGFALARAFPSRGAGGGASSAPPQDPDPGQ